MGFSCGIVGLPNIGKSTLFNALTNSKNAAASNYPFCTIEPNIGRISVPDERLRKLSTIAGSAKLIPTQIEFIDIAGLVRGASKGEGLGNKFLSHIREVDAIIHVLRCFDDGEVTHVENEVSPIRDAEIIEIELQIADLESLERRIANLEKKAKHDKELAEELETARIALEALYRNEPVRNIINKVNKDCLKKLNLITDKPFLYVANVSDEHLRGGNDMVRMVEERARSFNTQCIVIAAKTEAEIAQLESQEDRKEFMEAMGMEQTGLERLIRAGYDMLELLTFFTVGPKEAHAWTIRRNTTAPKAAGVIHTDFEKGFIKAETISYDDYIRYNGELGVKEVGKMRIEGKDYIIHDGDIMHFRFNV